MCFKIDPKAKPPGKRVAWKVVFVTKFGYVRSEHYPEHKWSTGVKHCSSGPTSSPPIWAPDSTARYARAGIYVYLRRIDALRSINRLISDKYHGWLPVESGLWCRGGALVVMKVKVSDRHWRHTDARGRFATYSQVEVPEEQPYFEWY